jgi:septal ring factor EnvC (AmiA/AmiB activator)
MRIIVLLFLLVILGYPCQGLGQVLAVEHKPTDQLTRVERDLKAEQARLQEFTKKQKDLQEKLSQLQDEMVTLSNDIQIHEKALLKVQKQSQRTQSELDEVEKTLDKQRTSLVTVIMALQRLNRMPPQMLLARPGKPIDTARSFYILSAVIPEVNKQADLIKSSLDQLRNLKTRQKKQESTLKKDRNKLIKKQNSMDDVVKKRQALLNQTVSYQQSALKKTKSLAQQAKDLRDLLSRLNSVPVQPQVKPRFTESMRNWFGSNNTKLPVAGDIKLAYGQALPGGGISQGLTITAISGAIVVAPSSGVIRFAGPFRQYKLLIIIQHPNGEHTLLGGLQEIYTRVGDAVTAGEPLGKLVGGNKAESKLTGDRDPFASLYYERRRHGKPIDPRLAKG